MWKQSSKGRAMYQPAITGTGVFVPPEVITNEELVESYNWHADWFNAEHAAEIAAGKVEAKEHSSAEFIFKASGIMQRHVLTRDGLMDPERMYPRFRQRSDDEPCLMAEMALKAAAEALAKAGVAATEIDLVICAASNMERAYPAVSIEIQKLLGAKGFAFDMMVGCSSATVAVQAASDMIRNGSVRKALIVSPEITTGHIEWRDRDCHFIFGDACTAVVLERAEAAQGPHFLIRSCRCATEFSNNIRNNNGFLRRNRPDGMADRRDMQFVQEGRRVFKEVVPLVSAHILGHLHDEGLEAAALSRLWLHQANKAMNDMIGRRVLGRDPRPGETPNLLQEYANTSSAGAILAFDMSSDGMEPGDLGLICSYGAGYSVGSVLLERA
ncbi:MAG: beta-ketoacyl-ACP synthase III [Phaeovulum sp.]|uniref:beta-ketoacyl-ACP synthase III n=1 Tax=Phaeovulum sp. TaxID=2934796 RepID=UPI002735E5FE|nr:beta-ketoacyl-ACP synthase III [Phaeovulum sp.]MDP3862993.1 beta-ketoacyl-ACP synthase III [Phaeovulum sp.]